MTGLFEYMQLKYSLSPAQLYGPPATMPAPLIIDEWATCNWTAKKPPEERPDTEVSLMSTLYLPRDCFQKHCLVLEQKCTLN